jgi:acetolactate synthase-1/3 small subunit
MTRASEHNGSSLAAARAEMAPPSRHTINVLVRNQSGVLARVAGLFSGRNFNIETLCVAPSVEAHLSLMTIVTTGDELIVEQITKQLNRLVDVIKVTDVTVDPHVERELCLVRLDVGAGEQRAEVLRIVDIFRAKVVDVQARGLILEITGDQEKLDAFVNLLKPLGLREVARTGRIAMSRVRP